MRSVEYLEAVKRKFDLKNDRQLALHMGMAPNTISQYVLGKRVMDDEACLAVALQLEIDPMQVLGAAFLDRAEKTGQKSLWEVFMTRTAMTAGAVLMASGVNLFLTTGDANAASMRVADPATSVSIDYANIEIRDTHSHFLINNHTCRNHPPGQEQSGRSSYNPIRTFRALPESEIRQPD